jgi:Histidine-specific methyltransferase, SAM-dependent
MPFSAPFDSVYQVILEVLDERNIRHIRADEILRSEPFIENIFKEIDHAGLVIGVTTGANANVAYELGYAHHMTKEMILLTAQVDDIPSDLRHVQHLVYDALQPEGARQLLKEWLDQTRFVSDLSYRTYPVLTRGEVFETIIDGTFYLQKVRPTPSKIEIRNCLRAGTSMPQRLLYITEEGQQTYLNLCEDPNYLYHHETLQFVSNNVSDIITRVLDHCKSQEVDFISLGPGNGQKDACFLTDLGRRTDPSQFTYYYPYDVSGGLLLEAMRNIMSRDLQLPKLRVKAIEADVSVLADFRRVFDYRPEPNVFSLLGGLANLSSEVDLLLLIRRLMRSRDVLLLEARKKTRNKTQSLGSIDLNRRLDLAPLAAVGAVVDPSSVEYKSGPSTSTIPNTATVAARVPGLVLDNEAYVDVTLFSVHYYSAADLERTLMSVGFSVLFKHVGPNSLFYICGATATGA